MYLVRAYKTELDLSHAQITACKQHAGAARWAYNWGLRRELCGLTIDRDVNAAINLSQLADSSPDSLNACGEGSAGLARKCQVKLSLVKQEPNTLYPCVE